jgi:hypothetical protein
VVVAAFHFMKRLILCIGCVIGLMIAACATTDILSTWRKPGVERLTFNKVVVVSTVKDEALRRQTEDQLVAQMAPTPAVPSYPEELMAALKKSDCDGALVMNLKSVDKEATWVPGAGGYGYWGWYDPGYVQVDTYVRIETKIYRLPSEELLWAATSRTANPTSTRSLVNEVSSTLRTELRDEGLIAPAAH